MAFAAFYRHFIRPMKFMREKFPPRKSKSESNAAETNFGRIRDGNRELSTCDSRCNSSIACNLLAEIACFFGVITNRLLALAHRFAAKRPDVHQIEIAKRPHSAASSNFPVIYLSWKSSLAAAASREPPTFYANIRTFVYN